jgi:hypothetical protein
MAVMADGIPRYAEPSWAELAGDTGPCCGDCRCFKDVCRCQNGLTEYVGACVFEVFEASTPDELADADVVHVSPTDPACEDFGRAS